MCVAWRFLLTVWLGGSADANGRVGRRGLRGGVHPDLGLALRTIAGRWGIAIDLTAAEPPVHGADQPRLVDRVIGAGGAGGEGEAKTQATPGQAGHVGLLHPHSWNKAAQRHVARDTPL